MSKVAMWLWKNTRGMVKNSRTLPIAQPEPSKVRAYQYRKNTSRLVQSSVPMRWLLPYFTSFNTSCQR